MSIYKKLNEFKRSVAKVKKDSVNPHFRNKYATIESVLETIEDPLIKAGLGFYQSVKDMSLETVLYEIETDSTLTSCVPLILKNNDMQQLGSALTYARRYGLVALLGLEQEDDDANLAVSGSNNNVNTGVNYKPPYNQTSSYTKPYNQEKRKPTPDEVLELEDLIIKAKKDKANLLSFFKVEKLEDIDNYVYCKNILLKQIKKNEEEADNQVPF